MSCTFVESWVDHNGETGNVDDKPGRGRNNGTSKSVEKAIIPRFEKKVVTQSKRS